jgi:hypothetical protein
MTQIQDAPATRTSTSQWAHEDVGNIISLEHVNTCIPDQALTTLFYIVGLGFTRDPYMNVGTNNMWINIGEQQLHMPTRPAQVMPGHVGVVVPDVDQLPARLESVKEALKGTKFTYSVEDGYVSATSPWGNVFHCFAPDPRFGNIKLGIAYVEIPTRRGTAEGIVKFYQQVMRNPGSVEERNGDAIAHIPLGTQQWIDFRESDEEIPEYDNHHIAVYITDFSGPYEWLRERNLLKADVRNHMFRMQEIVDPDTGEHLKTIEHEVRSMRHPMYHREMVNRNACQSMGGYARGHDASSQPASSRSALRRAPPSWR